MLTPFQAFLSAALTALLVQYLSLKYENQPENKSSVTFAASALIDRTVPKTLLLPTSSADDEPTPEVNKLLDALFVSHGIEEETAQEAIKPQKKEILVLDDLNFSAVYTGNWLILA